MPKFLLGGDEEGVVWERSGKEEGKKKTTAPARSGGVTGTKFSDKKATYTPSREAKQLQESQKKTEPAAEEKPKEEGVVSRVLSGIRGFFKNILNFLWYGDEKEKSASEKKEDSSLVTTKKKEESVTKPQTDEDRIKAYIKAGDTNGVVDVLTKGGTVQPARNSTLLTKYDRRGHIVEGNRMNTGVILHGDNPIEL